MFWVHEYAPVLTIPAGSNFNYSKNSCQVVILVCMEEHRKQEKRREKSGRGRGRGKGSRDRPGADIRSSCNASLNCYPPKCCKPSYFLSTILNLSNLLHLPSPFPPHPNYQVFFSPQNPIIKLCLLPPPSFPTRSKRYFINPPDYQKKARQPLSNH